MNNKFKLLNFFRIPIFVLTTILLNLVFSYILKNDKLSIIIILLGVIIGSFELVKETFEKIIKKDLALDYIAITAIITALTSQQYLVASIIVLMLSGGGALESYATIRAKSSLSKLADRIPNSVTLWQDNTASSLVKIDEVNNNTQILIRRGEIIPIDGILDSNKSTIDESSLTGEPYPVDKYKGDILRSGTINQGDSIVVTTIKTNKDSTYNKILEMVRKAQEEKSPLIRLADKYNIIFTVLTFLIAATAYIITKDSSRILAVLVIATPCPLILATPIALIGGMNSSARKGIIIKRLGSLEVLSRVNALIFDKTGTITEGKPTIKNIEVLSSDYSEDEILSISASIERNSLHPLAKAIVNKAHLKKLEFYDIAEIKETIGKGISGKFNNKTYSINGHKSNNINQNLVLKEVNDTEEKNIGIFELEDKLKKDSIEIFRNLKSLGIKLYLFTGDRKERAEDLVRELGVELEIKADCQPEDKKLGIEELKKQGFLTAMIGDGINDAPALAIADVGMVFTNEEDTAASQASDIIFLGGDLNKVIESYFISKRTIEIATESIVVGIGLSLFFMLIAATGSIVPIVGAFLQEAIDISVIINSLRASRIKLNKS